MRRGGTSTILCFNSAATWLKVKHVVVVCRFHHFLHVLFKTFPKFECDSFSAFPHIDTEK